MRSFFGGDSSVLEIENADFAAEPVSNGPAADESAFSARIAVYDSAAAAPRVERVASASPDTFIEELAARTYAVVRDLGGALPYTVVREVVENLIHADFREPVVSVLNGGNTVRFSDQGPGIGDKARAVLPGYTTATSRMKDLIRGVGSGLPIVSEFLAHQSGTLDIEDNLGGGTVVTLHIAPRVSQAAPGHSKPAADSSTPGKAPRLEPRSPALAAPDEEIESGPQELPFSYPHLSNRQKKVLSLVMECGEAGPTLVSKELAVGLSTAYRDLAFLEEQGLIASDESGKREITPDGTDYLDSLFG